ncbi:Basic-leucine zipper (bZIP) transcription factor family protein [Rhynchospora pubera]|uniref:Basic-leucine zipper (BZIP) transcription factor family protein n=1 Tax=Rhynchospora pubera TaxID=906938 RepID=A0AAV8HY60_9POAL|nr:Basic-leucine zipper (bZIP) transcription factor family protein [Rhynchospora pubera]
MAQLPPKVPSIAAPNWAPATWVDEFLEFSTAKRNSHRRSASDSIAFFEEYDGEGHEFNQLDHDQMMMSLFMDEPKSMHQSIEKESSPSDNCSIDEDKLMEQLEAESDCKDDKFDIVPRSEKISDPKRVKRILANRQSAQRSRVRKLQYVSELERSVSSLQAKVSTLSPRVALLDHQRSLLTIGNSHLKQRIAALTQDNIFKDAHQEALKRELERLRKIYQEQCLENNMDTQSPEDPSSHFEKDLLSCDDAAALHSTS